jgi:chromosome segregation and condensation protein ScpB
MILKSKIESILFLNGEPMAEAKLAKIVEAKPKVRKNTMKKESSSSKTTMNGSLLQIRKIKKRLIDFSQANSHRNWANLHSKSWRLSPTKDQSPVLASTICVE